MTETNGSWNLFNSVGPYKPQNLGSQQFAWTPKSEMNLSSLFLIVTLATKLSLTKGQRELAPLPSTTSLVTTFANPDNLYNGNSFDLVAQRCDLELRAFDLHFDNAGATGTVKIFWRLGTADGFENVGPAGWKELVSKSVTSMGEGQGTRVEVPPLTLRVGETMGFLTYGPHGTFSTLYHTSGPFEYSNADLKLISKGGVGMTLFSGRGFNTRRVNARVYYGEECLSRAPSSAPSDQPSVSSNPSSNPSGAPSTSMFPSSMPSIAPSYSSESPSTVPSAQPSLSNSPSDVPSITPSISAVPTKSFKGSKRRRRNNI